jgi:2'-5' RNA ligase
MIPSADTQPNDRFGYSCYAIVLPASDALIETVSRIRQASGMVRAAIPAHVTVKGTFVGIDDLEQVKQLVAEIAAETSPIFLSFDGAVSTWREKGAYLKIPVSAELQRLHDRLVAAIGPLGTAAYRDDPYVAHMTYVQDLPPEGMEKAKAIVDALDFGAGFTAEGVDLMGRVGPAYGGEWRLIERFPLGAKAAD